jgi:AcrR family transcriptional regulator
MPKLWNETIESHRRDVAEAVLAAAAELVGERGLMSVTMSAIAERTGIGRATLYKYYPDVESILNAWHERQIAAHLDQLTAVRDRADEGARLESVREAYALIIQQTRQHADVEVAALLHRDGQVGRARSRVREMIVELVSDAARRHRLRGDVPPEELAGYCMNALGGAAQLKGKAAIRRLVAVTLDGLRRGGG